jgi:hypothetical protein
MPSNSRRLLSCVLLAAAAFVALPAFAGEPTAADRKEAKRLYAEARKLKADGKLDQAVDSFRRAHDLAPTPVTRLDLARVLVEQAKLLEARDLAQSVPAMPITATETEKSKQSRKEAAALAKELDERIPTVTFAPAPDAAQEVAIDGKVVSKELLTGAVALDPGDHIAVLSMGEKKAETPFKLAERERKTVDLAVPPPEKAVEPVPEPLKPVKPAEKPRKAPNARAEEWLRRKNEPLTPAVPVLLSVGGALIVAGAISGGVALSQADELLLICGDDSCPRSAEDALSTHDATATASTVLFALGGATAVAGAVVWIVDAANRPSGPPSGPPGGPAPKVAFRLTGTGFAIQGTWP